VTPVEHLYSPPCNRVADHSETFDSTDESHGDLGPSNPISEPAPQGPSPAALSRCIVAAMRTRQDPERPRLDPRDGSPRPEAPRFRDRVRRGVRPTPARAVSGACAVLILIGTVVLCLPPCWGPEPVSPLDCLFTATSAVCVTGLVSKDTQYDWSVAGQTAIAFLIEAGGLGVMFLSAATAMLLRRRLGMRRHELMHTTLDITMRQRLRDVVRAIGMLTLAVEALGAVFLCAFYSAGGMPFARAIGHAAFHSVSAFCNAGFSLNSENLVAHADSAGVLHTIAALVILGGLGFQVHVNLLSYARAARLRNVEMLHFRVETGPPPRIRCSLIPWLLSFRVRGREHIHLHTRIVLTVTVVLIVVGTLLILLCEGLSGGAFGSHSPAWAVQQAYFHSVSARTAGFNMVDIGAMRDSTLFVLIVLMFIGASPGSTGGGMKTTSLAVILAAIYAMATHRHSVEWRERTIPQMVVFRALAIGALFLMLASACTMALLATASLSIRDALFESVSALGTGGLSTGVTPHLPPAAKLALVITMYAGRIGPLTLLLSLGTLGREGRVRYPEADVSVG